MHFLFLRLQIKFKTWTTKYNDDQLELFNQYKVIVHNQIQYWISMKASFLLNLLNNCIIVDMNHTWRILLLTILFLLTRQQLIAIDFGTEFIKVGMIHSGAGKAFSIVESTKSDRKIETAISFVDNDRFYQSQAVNKRLKFPMNTFLYTKLFIEYLNNKTQLIEIQKSFFLHHDIVNDETNEMISFILGNFNFGEDEQKVVITLEQLFGMIFRNIKKLSQKHGNAKIKDCVITIPNYWTLDQRIIITNALAIADLYPLSIINQNTAAAIQYGMNRNDNQTHRVVFYNLGAHSLQFSVVEFRLTNDSRTKKPVQSVFVIAQFGIPKVGGLQFDLLLSHHLQSVFQKIHKKKINEKAKLKIQKSCKKIKQVLSANKDAQVVVEQVFEGIDFQSKVTRAQFENLSTDLFQDLTNPIVPFLLRNDLRPDDIHNVELIGGSVRIPKLQSLLNVTFPKSQVGTHINGDESMALGAVFYAANSSKKFKVKGMHLYDGFNFEIRLVLKNQDSSIEEDDPKYYYKNITLFKKKHRFGLVKQVNFKCKQNIIAEFWKEDQSGLQLIKRVHLTNVSNYKENDKFAKLVPKVSIALETDPLQVVVVSEAKVIIVSDQTVSYVEQVKKQKKKSKKKKVQTEAQSTNTQQTSENKNQTKKNKKSNQTQQQQYEYQTVQRQKSVQKTYNLKIVKNQEWHLRERITDASLTELQKLLKKFDEGEQFKKKVAEAKNRLEAIVYQGKQLLQNSQFVDFSTQSQRMKIQEQIDLKQQIMYDQSTYQGYTKFYRQLQQPIQKIKSRITEERQREDIKKKLYDGLKDYKDKVKKFQKQNSWLTQDQIQPLSALIQKTEQQLNSIYQEQSKKNKYEQPVILNKKLLKKLDSVKDLYYSLKNIPKPKQTKKKEQKPKQADEEL